MTNEITARWLATLVALVMVVALVSHCQRNVAIETVKNTTECGRMVRSCATMLNSNVTCREFMDKLPEVCE